uniref:G-protein coupled receptors family 3 profile domain-containing protein n=1 Tax=Monopterus albus TaxID=43700 RepID=A0A3Q3IIX8_MONAL
LPILSSVLGTEKVSGFNSSLLQCVKLQDSESLALESEGDVVIGGVFPLHYVTPEQQHNFSSKPPLTPCSGFDYRAFRWMMTMVFTVEEINRNSRLLPGVKLGYRIMDSCDHVYTSLNGLFLVSYFATCTCLSDKHMYPSFLRTVPSDIFQVRGIVQLVTFLGWFWVGTVGTMDDYSHYGIQAFSNQFRQQGGCVAFHATIPKSPTVAEIQEMADRLQSSPAKVVVAFATEGQLLDLFFELALRNVTGIQWVASEAWVTARLLTSPHFHHLLEGTLGFAFPGVWLPGLEEFLLNVRPSLEPGMEFVSMFWEELFGCRLEFGEIRFKENEAERPVCTGSEDLRFTHTSYTDVSPVRISYNVYKAVYAIAHALHTLMNCDSCSDPCPPGSRQARRLRQPSCCFDCLPCADGEISNHTGSNECRKCPEYYWSDNDKVKCIAGVEEFLSFSDTMGIILVGLTLLGVVLTTFITTVFHHFRSTPIVKANNSEISFLLLLSLKLCFLCSLVFIGQPSVWKCWLCQAAFGISFVLCLSCLLVKTIVVLLAFWTNVPGSRALKQFGPSQQRTLILCTTAPQVCLCACWLLLAPPFPFRNPTYQPSTGKIIVECKDPWPPGFYLVLGYIGLLAFLCLLLAFLGRKLPDTFNEAKLITFSMLIFCAVWISFIPAYVSSPGKFTVAVEIFAILASSFGLLLCIFVPKCFIILLQPERNIKRGMTGKYPR